MIDFRFKFYLIIRIADFQAWRTNNPNAWQNWRPRFINAFDITTNRISNNGVYAIVENLLSYFDERQKIINFENLISGFTWVEIFPRVLTPAWITAGYTQSIFDILNLYPALWGEI